jgi:hypothetical protein
MQLVHARHEHLMDIWKQLRLLGCDIHLQVVLSRPNSEVIREVNHLEKHATYDIQVVEAPFNPLEAGKGERFMELRRWQHDLLPPCDYGVIWDDDHYLEDPQEARKLLECREWDLIYATKAFFWGDREHIATHIPTHRSVFFFRCLPGDEYPLDRVIHAPSQIHDNATQVTDLRSKLLDFGYLNRADRDRCWADYKGVGKIDSATSALIDEPTLELWRPTCADAETPSGSEQPARSR